MRARLVGLAVAVTAMVVIAFTIPLAVLVRDIARDQAVGDAEREANALARTLAVIGDTSPATIAALLASATGDLDVAVVAADGSIVGDGEPAPAAVDRARAGSAVRTEEAGGVAIYVPVLSAEEGAVVRSWVGPDRLERNVALSWVLLAGLGVVLVALAGLLADRLGRSMVRPVEELAAATRAVGTGDLSVSVTPAGPRELREVSSAFNELVARIRDLLQSEREAVADLSHRLRTPLTALHLDVEALGDGAAADEVRADLDYLERMVDQLIDEARRPVRTGAGVAESLSAVVRERLAFWEPLAAEQGRTVHVTIDADPLWVALPRHDLEAAIDALVGNVIAHTPDGTSFYVTTSGEQDAAVLEVADDGPGIPSIQLTDRGRSGSGSTGLGLDIVAKTARATGGDIEIGSRPNGGSRILMRLARS